MAHALRIFGRIVLFVLAVALVAIIALAVYVKVTRGSGDRYPDVSTPPLYGADALEIVAELPLPPGNVAVSAEGRIFFNYHYLGVDGDENGYSVFELVDGEPIPYPGASFQPTYQSTLGMLIDRRNRLWVIDPAAIDRSRNTRLFAFDLATDTLAFDYTFETDDADFAQDVQVTSDGRYVIAASTGLFGFIPANLIVLDTQTGIVRTLLEGHESVGTQPWRIHTQEGEGVSVFFGLIDWQAGVDGIALTKDDEWLYYGSINHDTLYRIRTRFLLDPTLSDQSLASRVEAVGTKPLSDGFSMDLDGNVYITDIENGGVARMTPEGQLTTLVADARVRWADGISFGPDSMIYLADSAIPAYLTQTGDPLPIEEHRALAPYYIFRFRNDTPGVPGS
jgi:sugar lactone lactonase YvrE